MSCSSLQPFKEIFKCANNQQAAECPISSTMPSKDAIGVRKKMGTVPQCAVFSPEFLPWHQLFPLLGTLFVWPVWQFSPGPSRLSSSSTSFVKPSPIPLPPQPPSKALLPSSELPPKKPCQSPSNSHLASQLPKINSGSMVIRQICSRAVVLTLWSPSQQWQLQGPLGPC